MNISVDQRRVYNVYIPDWTIRILEEQAIKSGCVRLYGGKVVANVSEFLRRWTYRVMQEEGEIE